MKFFGRKSNKKKAVPATLESLGDTDVYPVLDARELIQILGVGGRISTIKRHASVSPEMYETHYQALIHRFLEAAQLQPASATDHHAGLGGLITHTLEVVEIAMANRRAYHLPINSPVEKIARQETAWTYAVFVAAILHDAGKLLTLTRLVPTNNAVFSPLAESIMDTGADSYRIEWASDEIITGVSTLYELQTRISVSMLTLIPKPGLTLISRDMNILKEITAYLSDLPYEWGIIGKLCQQADMRSVSSDMQPGVLREQINGAPAISLAKRMINALRAEIKKLSVPINKNGAAAWVTDDAMWLVSERGVNIIRNNMLDNGATDVPNDDTRLYSILLDHGYIVPTPDGRAIWNVRIKCDQYDHAPMTMLKFPRNSVIHPTRKIQPFVGNVTPMSREEADTLRKQSTPPPSPTLPPHTSEPEHTGDSTAQQASGQSTVNATPLLDTTTTVLVADAPDSQNQTSPVVLQKPDQPAQPSTDNSTITVSAKNKKKNDAAPKPFRMDELTKPTERAAKALNDSVIRKRSDIQQSSVELSHEYIGRYFLSWVREAIDSGHIRLDSSRPPIHFIEDEVDDKTGRPKDKQKLALLVWPVVGHDFMKTTGLETSDDKEQKKRASNKIRLSLKKDGLILTRPGRYDIWHAQLPTRTGMVSSTMYCLVAPVWTLFDDNELPELNADISLRHGDYNPNHRPIKEDQRRSR